MGKDSAKPDASFVLLGCSAAEAGSHIEAQFQPGMTWSNYGEWEIDHVCPLAGFDLADPEQARAAAHFANLQPLWKAENGAKGGRVWSRPDFSVLCRFSPQ